MMLSTTDSSFGTIVPVPFPFTDQTGGKKRPGVIVSSPDYYRYRGDLVLMAVTSRLSSETSEVGGTPVHGWRDAGLLRPSQFKPVLATISGGLVLRKLGVIGPEDKAELRRLLAAVLG